MLSCASTRSSVTSGWHQTCGCVAACKMWPAWAMTAAASPSGYIQHCGHPVFLTTFAGLLQGAHCGARC